MDYNPADLIGNERKRQFQELEREVAAEQHRADLHAVMASETGRRFVWDLIERSGTLPASCFVAGSPDLTAFKLGHASFGSDVVAWVLKTDPDLYILAAREAATHKAILRERTQQQLRDDDGN